MPSLTDNCQFLHRQNMDESWDSICLDCLQIVAGEVSEDDFEWFEFGHICLSRDHHACALPNAELLETR